VRPASIIDLGAAVGEWSELAYSVFPDTDFVLVEPLRERTATLAAFSARHPRMCHVAAAAGASQTLAHTTLLVIEVYNFSVSPTAVPFGNFVPRLPRAASAPRTSADSWRGRGTDSSGKPTFFSCLPTFPLSAIRATLNDTAAHSMVKPNLNDGKFLGWRRCSTKATGLDPVV
jgi:hypothetical protein